MPVFKEILLGNTKLIFYEAAVSGNPEALLSRITEQIFPLLQEETAPHWG